MVRNKYWCAVNTPAMDLDDVSKVDLVKGLNSGRSFNFKLRSGTYVNAPSAALLEDPKFKIDEITHIELEMSIFKDNHVEFDSIDNILDQYSGGENIRVKAIYIKNLKMSPGKLAAQVAHAIKNLDKTPPDIDIIVLGVNRKQFTTLIQEDNGIPRLSPVYIQVDKGKTEVDEGTVTAAAWIERTALIS